jgi:hypothetical protein
MFKRDAEVGGEVGSLAELALCSEGVQTGAVVVPFVLGDGVAAIASAHLARRLGRAVLAAGCLLLLAGLGSVAIVLRASSPGPDGRWLVLPLCVAGIGTGMSIALNQDVTLWARSACGSRRGERAPWGVSTHRERLGYWRCRLGLVRDPPHFVQPASAGKGAHLQWPTRVAHEHGPRACGHGSGPLRSRVRWPRQPPKSMRGSLPSP